MTKINGDKWVWYWQHKNIEMMVTHSRSIVGHLNVPHNHRIFLYKFNVCLQLLYSPLDAENFSVCSIRVFYKYHFGV